MDFRMQRFHAAVHHFRKAGVIGDFGDRNFVFGEHLGGAASGKNFYAQSAQFPAEFDNSGFIGDADQSVKEVANTGRGHTPPSDNGKIAEL